MSVTSVTKFGSAAGGERWALTPEHIPTPVPHQAERWNVVDTPGTPALDAWADILSVTHLGFDVSESTQSRGRFRGSVTRRRLGDLQLVDCASAPFKGHRGTELLNGDPGSVIGFQFVRRGVEHVRDKACNLSLTAGDVIVWNGWQPVDIEVVEPFAKRTLIVPSERILSVCPRLEDAKAMPPVQQGPAARLLVRYLDALAQELPWLDDAAAAAAADAALELLRSAVEPTVPSSRTARRSAIRVDVRRYIRAHLQDALLGPEAIAKAHAISVRTLHALFEDCEESVAGLVRRERLARCLEDLRRPSGGSVTEIAFRWGFRDAAHFARVFKREFGQTPSDVRGHAAAEEAALTA
ncbi:MAG: transcriptional regulator, AraC family [Solirubrobacterales bacterium]|nr:transcriptional regulator, AraC family [Solirubrobacterales bacterium]